ncbi:hypothetical protein M3J09_003001 [Ascochyta lentis]
MKSVQQSVSSNAARSCCYNASLRSDQGDRTSVPEKGYLWFLKKWLLSTACCIGCLQIKYRCNQSFYLEALWGQVFFSMTASCSRTSSESMIKGIARINSRTRISRFVV